MGSGLRVLGFGLTRIDSEMIDYRIRVENPVTDTAPFTLRLTITSQPGYVEGREEIREFGGAGR